MSNMLYILMLSILIIPIGAMCYAFVYRAFNRNYFGRIKNSMMLINEEYHRKLVIKREKQKTLKLKRNRDVFFRLSVLIDKTGLKSSSFFWFLNPNILILLCLCSSFAIYIFFERVFKLISIGLIMGVPGFFFPVMILGFIAQKKEENIERTLGNFLLLLKNNTKIHNDILEAFRAVQNNCIEPLRTFVKQFLAEINSGICVDEALSNLKYKINIDRFRLFLTNIQYCYTYGGSFTELLTNTQKLILEIQKEKKRRIQETRSARLILFILMALDLFLYFNFIRTEPEYLNIMRTTIWGQIILNFNFLSLWLLAWLSYSVKALDY